MKMKNIMSSLAATVVSLSATYISDIASERLSIVPCVLKQRYVTSLTIRATQL